MILKGLNKDTRKYNDNKKIIFSEKNKGAESAAKMKNFPQRRKIPYE